ncbi:signal peptidase I [Floccifex sp.]|uniref:signal peptidase I n=1 Tax=Floccifex sp. TaxID=2815810 RepID=UPI003F03086D
MKKDQLKYNEEDERTIIEDILDFVKVFAATALVFLLFVNFIAHPVTVQGRSMYPTLKDGQFGFTSIISTLVSDVKRGDVVVIKMYDEEIDKETHWVKRVIGLPGETVSCQNDEVYINGEVLDESEYIDQEYRQEMIYEFGYFNKVITDHVNEEGIRVVESMDFESVTLQDDEYFLLGDNRPYSKDSRDPSVGPIKESQIFGKSVLVLFPLNEIGIN